MTAHARDHHQPDESAPAVIVSPGRVNDAGCLLRIPGLGLRRLLFAASSRRRQAWR